MDLIFFKNNINIQKYLVSRYFFAESIVSVSRYIFKSILQYSAACAAGDQFCLFTWKDLQWRLKSNGACFTYFWNTLSYVLHT